MVSEPNLPKTRLCGRFKVNFRIAGFPSRRTGFVNTGRHSGTNLPSTSETIMYQNDSDWPREPTLLNAESRGISGTVCFRGSRWQGEVERRATPAVAVGPDLSAM